MGVPKRKKKKRHSRRPQQQCTLLATPGTVFLDKGETAAVEAEARSEPSLATNPLSTLSQQTLREGNFRREPKADDWLKYCWGQVLQINGDNLHLNQGLPYFMVKRGLIFYHCSHWDEPCDLLVVLWTKINSMMHLAHSHPLSSHLGS